MFETQHQTAIGAVQGVMACRNRDSREFGACSSPYSPGRLADFIVSERLPYCGAALFVLDNVCQRAQGRAHLHSIRCA